MWQLWHKLFGWHYVMYSDSCTTFVARVKELPSGCVYMFCGYMRNHYNNVLLPDGKFHRQFGNGKWTPLTWDGSLSNEQQT